MTYTVRTTNQAEDTPDIEVGDEEFIDLQRHGLIVPGKGDVNGDGVLKKTVEAPPVVRTAAPATGSITTQGAQ